MQKAIDHLFIMLSLKPPPAKKRDMRVDRIKSSVEENINPEKYSEDLKVLKQEYAKDKPCKKSLRRLMSATYEGTIVYSVL